MHLQALVLLLSVAAVLSHAAHPGMDLFLQGVEPHRQAKARNMMLAVAPPQLHTNNAVFASNSTPTVNVLSFGADPTGKTDSTAAFQAAVAELLTMGSGHFLSNGIADLGGAVLELGGGDYLISAPIVIPVNYGNFHIQQGTIRASPSFPPQDYIVTIGGSCSNSQGSCNENVGLNQVMLDCQQVCAGGLSITATMGANVGPQMFFLGFTANGILISGGHEVMVHETWLGEYLYSDPRSHLANMTASGISVNGNDHFITNTIVFSSKIGVSVSGAANLLTGVHTWNLDSPHSGIGIFVDAPGYTQNRIVACYLDYNSLVAVDPEHLVIVDSFFLCGGAIVIQSSGNGNINGLSIMNNEFDQCNNDTVIFDERNGPFSGAYDVVIADNMATSGYTVKSTQAQAQLTLQNATQWTFDFSSVLLLPSIVSVSYSIEIESGFAQHASRPPNGLSVTVETDVPVSGTVTMFVDQSTPSHPVTQRRK